MALFLEKRIKKIQREFNIQNKIDLLKCYADNTLKRPDLDLMDIFSVDIADHLKNLNYLEIVEIFKTLNKLNYENEDILARAAKVYLKKFDEEFSLREEKDRIELYNDCVFCLFTILKLEVR